ncbi:flagellar export chaperone FliS [Ferriphaselus sp. R-1]|uniref:flagellar export chaperone FliS n=1 Tax=Ferriphaselus sp. R-1 TaxID=1485544 RepID=UPI000556F802|nr:flagellar export chaperone FliS [Ferriphaselus sp. R-1]
MVSTQGINAYNKVGVESNIAGASPHDLIIMLYQAAIDSVGNARRQILQQEVAAKGASISRAISLVGSGLQASLDREAGGEIAQNLFDLYSYMVQRLVQANINNDIAILDEVERLLTDLLGAWESIKRPASQDAGFQPASNRVAMTYDRL